MRVTKLSDRVREKSYAITHLSLGFHALLANVSIRFHVLAMKPVLWIESFREPSCIESSKVIFSSELAEAQSSLSL